jgi:hypothetical protein
MRSIEETARSECDETYGYILGQGATGNHMLPTPEERESYEPASVQRARSLASCIIGLLSRQV